MKLFFIPIFGFVLTSTSTAMTRDVLSGPISARLIRVVDGDTLAVSALIWPGQHIDINVRLADIDAPELFRPKCITERKRAGEARDFLKHYVGEQITLKAVHLGKYAGRVIAKVETGAGEDLSTLLLRAGLAHTITDPSSWCPKAP